MQPMRRSIPFVICICLFTLASGMTIVALAQDVRRPPVSGHDRTAETAAANVDLVRRFYAEVGAVLATGDAALLDRTVAVDLVEHPMRPGAASGRDGFARALLTLRAVFAGPTLVVDDVRAAGDDQVVARVHTSGVESGVFLGRPVPPSLGEWGPIEVWRIADGHLVERWGGPVPAVLLPLGQTTISVDALGPGHRRLTLTHVTVEPGARLPVDNGQAVRVFAIERGTLTVEVAERSNGSVALATDTAALTASTSGTTFDAMTGDRVVTGPEAHYSFLNDGAVPAIILVVIVSNILDGDWPLNGASAAASWTVAAMPEALGGVLPSPDGISARVLAADVEIELPEQPTLALGWIFLMSGATFVLPAGDKSLVSVVVEGGADLTSTGGAGVAQLASGKWFLIPGGVGHLWQAGDSSLTSVLMLSMG
jgi:hypothetical protein